MRNWFKMLLRQRQRAKALRALADIRNRLYWRRKDLDAHLSEAGLSLEDIGSSEEEMRGFWLEHEKYSIFYDWEYIDITATMGNPVDEDIAELYKRLDAAGLKLEDLPLLLTNEMLEEARLRGWKNHAKWELLQLRGGTQDFTDPRLHVKPLREALVKAGLTPEDIGTSYAEIAWVENDEFRFFQTYTPTD